MAKRYHNGDGQEVEFAWRAGAGGIKTLAADVFLVGETRCRVSYAIATVLASGALKDQDQNATRQVARAYQQWLNDGNQIEAPVEVTPPPPPPAPVKRRRTRKPKTPEVENRE